MSVDLASRFFELSNGEDLYSFHGYMQMPEVHILIIFFEKEVNLRYKVSSVNVEYCICTFFQLCRLSDIVC